MMEESKTKQRTRRKFRQAFIRLLEDTGMDKITAVALAKEAGVNRSTFYAYYDDVYALISEMEEGILDTIHLQSQEMSQCVRSGDMEGVRRLSEKLMEKDGDAVMALLGPNGDHAFTLRLIETLQPLFLSMIGCTELTPDLEIFIAYESSGLVGVITQWYKGGKKQSMTQIVRMMQKLVEAGAEGFLQNKEA